MYVWEIQEIGDGSAYKQGLYTLLVKDDEKTLKKVKGIIMDYIRSDINECKDRLDCLSTQTSEIMVKRNKAWLDSLQNKIDEVNQYEFMRQFKNVELMSCDVYVNKIEVI